MEIFWIMYDKFTKTSKVWWKWRKKNQDCLGTHLHNFGKMPLKILELKQTLLFLESTEFESCWASNLWDRVIQGCCHWNLATHGLNVWPTFQPFAWQQNFWSFYSINMRNSQKLKMVYHPQLFINSCKRLCQIVISK